MSETACYRARWIFPTHSDPIEGGFVTIRRGRVVEIGSHSQGQVLDLGNVALTAGFCNPHTHLDLSLAPRAENAPALFTDWLNTIVGYRRNSADETISAIAAGIDEILQTGTTLIGDIATTDMSEPSMEEAGLAGTVFREVIGLKRDRYEPLFQLACQAVEHRGPNEEVRSGVSPHAPYSTARETFIKTGELARGTPVATHWLESPEEVEFLRTGNGPMREFLERLNAWTPDWMVPSHLAQDYLGGNVRWILIHANYLTNEEIVEIQQLVEAHRVAGVIYCPRTHAWFGHEPHPWWELCKHHIPVALGTDSRATAPDLSVFSEAQFVFAHDNRAEPKQLLDMVTVVGADMLGFGDEFGRLQVGSRADLAAIAIPESGSNNPYELLFGPASRPIGTMLNGFWIHDSFD